MDNSGGLDLQGLIGTQDDFITQLVNAKLSSSVDTTPNQHQDKDLNQLENILSTIISKNILNPQLEVFLIQLIERLQQNANPKAVDYISDLIKDYIRPAFLNQINRLLALKDPQTASILRGRFASVILLIPEELQQSYAIWEEEMNRDFTEKLRELGDEEISSIAGDVSDLVWIIKGNPEQIFTYIEYPVLASSLESNLYHLIKNAIRRFLTENPADSGDSDKKAKYQKLVSILHTPYGFSIVLKEFIQLIFTDNDFDLAWTWIDMKENGYDLPVYDSDKEIREEKALQIYKEAIEQYVSNVSITIRNLSNLQNSGAIKKLELNRIESITNNYIKNIIIKLVAIGIKVDEKEIRFTLFNSLSGEVKTLFLILLSERVY